MEGINPLTIAFDPALPYSDRMPALNRGCPEGYFAQLVDPHAGGDAAAVPPIPGVTTQTNYIVCRLIPDSLLDGRSDDTTVWTGDWTGMITLGEQRAADLEALRQESGTTWATTYENFKEAAKATIPQAGLGVAGVLLVVGALLAAPSIIASLRRG
ncbi:MAG: hypothetical protein L0214_07560 [candidate division NC10 bacterium]|nr:hypothetical protein [candidate division NC10 bacterium]